MAECQHGTGTRSTDAGDIMMTLDEARALLDEMAHALAPREVALADAVGRRLTRPVESDINLPPTDVSAMDGYATQSAEIDGQSRLPVAFEVAAGSSVRDLPRGAVARIFTGAPIPSGADTVVPQEQSRATEDGNVVLETCREGAHVRHQGEVVGFGVELAPSGAWVTPAMVSVLAACGASQLEVVPKPRIGIVVTGAEVVDATTTPGPGQIRDSNGPLLEALAASAAFDTPPMWRVDDTSDELAAGISEALSASDLVLTTGGVSVGDYDLVPKVVSDLGGDVVFHRLRVKPGKPVFAARIGNSWLIGLPGNPLAVLAGWRLIAWPLAAVLGGERCALREEPATLALEAPAPTPKSRTELRPALAARVNGSPTVTVLPWKGSHDVLAAARANALVRLEPDESYPKGASVPCYALPSGHVVFDSPGREW
ncbi:MAG: molybdopterin molybdotransferase MoeA [bacterium]|nr:molybdopterin molybdotransferase MoeA [bacterium]